MDVRHLHHLQCFARVFVFVYLFIQVVDEIVVLKVLWLVLEDAQLVGAGWYFLELVEFADLQVGLAQVARVQVDLEQILYDAITIVVNEALA